MTCTLDKCNIWALYDPTLDQSLLRKLIYLYLESAKPSKQIQNPKMLFKEIVNTFKTKDIKLDQAELNYIWNSLPEKVRNSFWKLVKYRITEFEK